MNNKETFGLKKDRNSGSNTSSTKKRRFFHAVSLFSLTGLICFIFEQLFLITFKQKFLHPIIAISYIIIFLIIGILSLAIVSISEKLINNVDYLRKLFLAGFLLTLVIAGLIIRRILINHNDIVYIIIKFTIVCACSLVFLIAYRWVGLKRLSGRRRLITMGFLLGITILWAILSPECVILSKPYCYWAGAVSLGLFLILLYKSSFSLSVPIKADLAAIAVMLLLVLITFLGNVWAINHARPHFTPDHNSTLNLKVKDSPNIFLIVWDTARRDHLSAYGYKRSTTPYLEKRARYSMVYNNVVSTSPWTLPSHASMFTGLYPCAHSAHWIYFPGMTSASKTYKSLPEEQTTLAEILTENGYHCGCISSNFAYISKETHMDQGFEYFYNLKNPKYMTNGFFDIYNYLFKSVSPWLPPGFCFHYQTPYMPAEDINKIALKWIDSIEDGRPFFVFLNYMDAHSPYYPPGDLAYKFPGFIYKMSRKIPEKLLSEMIDQNRPLNEYERSHLMSQYDAELLYLDSQLEEFEEALRRRGLFDDAVIILTSDHGEFFGEHNLLCHDQELYNEVLEIPLIVKYPDDLPSGADDTFWDNRKIFSIILEQAGVDYQDREDNPWNAIAEKYHRYPHKTKNGTHYIPDERTRRSVFFDQYKFISSSDGRDELFNIINDSVESVNLVNIEPEKAEKGRVMISQFLDQCPEVSDENRDYFENYNKEEIEKLKSLGYIQ